MTERMMADYIAWVTVAAGWGLVSPRMGFAALAGLGIGYLYFGFKP